VEIVALGISSEVGVTDNEQADAVLQALIGCIAFDPWTLRSQRRVPILMDLGRAFLGMVGEGSEHAMGV
jgi:hypothetical protein